MPAYMYALNVRCQMNACRKPQTHRVCNARNGTMGDYCAKHAKQRLADLQLTENRVNAMAYASPVSRATDVPEKADK